MIALERFAYSPMGTFGRLTIPNRLSCYTVERPWADNQPNVSCIPEGQYALRRRPSPVVERTTGALYRQGWEVCDVPGRSLIMIHPGNTIADVQGCIAVGNGLGWVNGSWAVMSSLLTFKSLMAVLDGLDTWQININSIRAGQLPVQSQRAFA